MAPDGPDSYTALLNVAVGPVKGKFKAKVKLSNQVPPESMTLQVEAKAPTGMVNAVGVLTLVDQGENTLVNWSGEPKLMGMIASLAGRLIGGISKQQADVFFANLELEALKPVSA
jgi:uncharacterized protein